MKPSLKCFIDNTPTSFASINLSKIVQSQQLIMTLNVIQTEVSNGLSKILTFQSSPITLKPQFVIELTTLIKIKPTATILLHSKLKSSQIPVV